MMPKTFITSSLFIAFYLFLCSAQGMDEKDGPQSGWGRFYSGLRGTVNEGLAHVQFSLASKVKYGSFYPATYAFLEQEVKKSDFERYEFVHPVTKDEMNSGNALSLSTLYIHIERNIIALYLMRREDYLSHAHKVSLHASQVENCTSLLAASSQSIVGIRRMIDLTEQAIELEKQGKAESMRIELEELQKALQHEQEKQPEASKRVEDSQEALDREVQAGKEKKILLEEMERQLGINDSITTEAFLAPCNTWRFSCLFKREDSTVKIFPLLPTIDTYGSGRKLCENLFDIEFPISLTCSYLSALLKAFPNQYISIYSPLGSEEHSSYVHIILEEGAMKVAVFEPGPPNIRTWFGSTDEPSVNESLEYFSRISEKIGLKLDHQFYFLKHQIFNGHDCARFSSIYLLNHLLKGKNPASLRATEVLEGMQYIEANGYETLQLNQDPSWKRPTLPVNEAL